ncbi:unnamed protein product [Vicia faba]|uniref:Uncharacterized protein n=1 Tax=Vicia faba TaxID=3906 RepID=A0AAV0ZFE7_VICFA|nr:unnamed protein product [Vicia faba]
MKETLLFFSNSEIHCQVIAKTEFADERKNIFDSLKIKDIYVACIVPTQDARAYLVVSMPSEGSEIVWINATFIDRITNLERLFGGEKYGTHKVELELETSSFVARDVKVDIEHKRTIQSKELGVL